MDEVVDAVVVVGVFIIVFGGKFGKAIKQASVS